MEKQGSGYRSPADLWEYAAQSGQVCDGPAADDRHHSMMSALVLSHSLSKSRT